MRYGADPLSVYDLPIDADALIALCAPRPVFISAGTQAAGDGWVDSRGSFEAAAGASAAYELLGVTGLRSEEHTSELQSLMRISYAVFCLKKKRHIISQNNMTL